MVRAAFVANELEAMPKIDARLINEEPITDMMKPITTQLQFTNSNLSA